MSEPQYIEALAREPEVRDTAAVALRLEAADKGEVPLTLVHRAIDVKRRAENENGEIDEIWCVFDVEWPQNHPHLPRAITLAKANGIFLAISNPCFEVWLTLHFRDVTRHLDNAEARRARRSCDSQPGKRLDARLYMSRRVSAALRAAKLDQNHLANGTRFPHNNPSSGMYLLVRTVSS